MQDQNYKFEISLSVLNHLGRNLYRNFVTVLGEAISNSWDACAENVWIDIDRDNDRFSIKDDGYGMSSEDFQEKFLRIGYSKRKVFGDNSSSCGRPYIGAKGIGKLALLSCAQRVSIFSKTSGTDYVGGVIDNSGLDKAITQDLTPDNYPLEALDYDLIKKLREGHNSGTIIVFDNSIEQLRNSDTYIKKLIAMSFKFSLLDPKFTIHVNGDPVTISDLEDLSKNTQLLWKINNYSDGYTDSLKNLEYNVQKLSSKLSISGFVATVYKPRDLKISSTDERATIDLFVNGRIREKNILRHIPTQRIVESYLYGQIHFDIMDSQGKDPFTSAREGVVEDNKEFKSLLDELKRQIIPKITDDWDKFRLELRQSGDEENTARKSKKDRKALDLYSTAKAEYKPEKGSAQFDQVNQWINELTPDAEFNISAYVDCFLSENLVRKYMTEQKVALTQPAQNEVTEWRDREKVRKGEANISFLIRKDNDDLSYLGMDYLVKCIEGNSLPPKEASLLKDAISYKPVRNAVGHTGLLSTNAKTHLSMTFENIKSRLRNLLSGK